MAPTGHRLIRSRQLSAGNQAGGGRADSSDLEIQIAQLEDTVEMYRQTLERFQSDSRDAQAKVILDLDLVKRADLDEALRKARSLEDGVWKVARDRTLALLTPAFAQSSAT